MVRKLCGRSWRSATPSSAAADASQLRADDAARQLDRSGGRGSRFGFQLRRLDVDRVLVDDRGDVATRPPSAGIARELGVQLSVLERTLPAFGFTEVRDDQRQVEVVAAGDRLIDGSVEHFLVVAAL